MTLKGKEYFMNSPLGQDNMYFVKIIYIKPKALNSNLVNIVMHFKRYKSKFYFSPTQIIESLI